MRYYNNSMNDPNNGSRLSRRGRLSRSRMNQYNTWNEDEELFSDNIDENMSFIKDKLGYDLIIKEDFIKLEKIPSEPKSFMGIPGFTEIEEYIFFMILLMFLEDKNKEEQFVLSNLT